MKFKKIFIIILFAVLLIAGYEGMQSFWSEHNYYQGMIFSWKNRGLIVSALFSAAIPALLPFYSKGSVKSLKTVIFAIGGGLVTFSILHEWILGNLLTFLAIFPLAFNVLFLYGISLLFILGVFALGNFIARKLKLFSELRWQETFLTFGIGLVVFLFGIQILMGLNILYSWIVWVFFVGLLCFAYYERKYLDEHRMIILEIFGKLSGAVKSSRFVRIFALLIISFAYYFFNFSHSYIPYSTAWDANHDYMYIPKVVSEHHGVLWGNKGPAATMPGLWHTYIAYFFSLAAPLSKVLHIAKDTFAVNLNALSGVFVLLFGLGALKEVLALFSRKGEESSDIAFLTGWGLLLLWLTSGMGAFLLFVDNKTDMGVFSLSLLAVLSGFVFLNYFNRKGAHIESKQNTKFLLISAFLFGFAIIAKVTAFIDAVIFVLIMVGLCLNTTTLIGLGVAVLGFLGMFQPFYAKAFLTKELGVIIFIIGIIIAIVGAVRGFIWRTENFTKRLKQIIVRGIGIVLVLFVFKGPWVLVGQLKLGNFGVKSFIQSTLLLYNSSSSEDSFDKPLLAQATDVSLGEQSRVDKKVLQSSTQDLTYNQCLKEHFDEDDLNSTRQDILGDTASEDLGRYIGFGWREFEKKGFGGLFLKLLFWKNKACYGWDYDGRVLCNNSSVIAKGDLKGLEELDKSLDQKGQAHQLVQNVFESYSSGDDLRDEFTALETYYQEHSILTTTGSVYIPYRYIVPLNIVFNWSLQNRSSYYTDIGIIWFCVFVVMLAGLIYSVCVYNKKNKQLMFLCFSAVIGWIIWWAIAAGILWYGLGLVFWSCVVVAVLFQEWSSDEDESLQLWSTFLIGLFIVYMFVQFIFNFSRIAAQGSSGPFGRYKSNVGENQKITSQLKLDSEVSYKYGADKIFDLQFGQYQPFINAVKKRKDEDGVVIAGTYIQYFLDNQRNIKDDGMLSWFWKETSDSDSCRSYQRLRNNNVKYIVIDPNIGTVGRAGEGNESLFYRFFARLSEDEKTIQTHGAITMLIKLAQDGYLDLIFTNNLGAKYAFELTDDELTSIFGSMSKDDMILLRAKMAVLKFFYNEDDLLDTMFAIFQTRIANGKAITDIGSILGKKVSESKLLPIASELIGGGNASTQSKITKLSQDERYVLVQYVGIYKHLMQDTNKSVIQQTLSSLFQNSIFGSSQIISLQLK